MRYRRVRLEGATYFFTIVTEGRRPIFNDPALVELFEAGLNRVKDRHRFVIDAYVILPDHIHAIWTLPEGDANYSMRWRLVKEAFTKAVVRNSGEKLARSSSRLAKAEQPVWQRRFWEHTIRNEAEFSALADYIHYNPVKHGIVEAVRDWPHSSFAEWAQLGWYEPHWGSADMPPLPKWAQQFE
jgi:putative transposase